MITRHTIDIKNREPGGLTGKGLTFFLDGKELHGIREFKIYASVDSCIIFECKMICSIGEISNLPALIEDENLSNHLTD